MIIVKCFEEYFVTAKGYQEMAWKSMNPGLFFIKEPECVNVATQESQAMSQYTNRLVQLAPKTRANSFCPCRLPFVEAAADICLWYIDQDADLQDFQTYQHGRERGLHRIISFNKT